VVKKAKTRRLALQKVSFIKSYTTNDIVLPRQSTTVLFRQTMRFEHLDEDSWAIRVDLVREEKERKRRDTIDRTDSRIRVKRLLAGLDG
jgi:hypothetical protein